MSCIHVDAAGRVLAAVTPAAVPEFQQLPMRGKMFGTSADVFVLVH